MDIITGFVPTGQVVDHPCRAKGCADQRSRQRPRSAGRAVAGFILLLLGFCLLICGGTIFTLQLAPWAGSLEVLPAKTGIQNMVFSRRKGTGPQPAPG